MKSKGSLLLMELLVMILVFSLASAVCLGIFAKSAELLDATRRLEEASFLAQNAAELLKATAGDFEKAQNLNQGEYQLEIQPSTGKIPGLGQADIRVYFAGECLASLTAGWQEVIP